MISQAMSQHKKTHVYLGFSHSLPNFCIVGRNSRLTGDFELQNSFAKVDSFAGTFATARGKVTHIYSTQVPSWTRKLDLLMQAFRTGEL